MIKLLTLSLVLIVGTSLPTTSALAGNDKVKPLPPGLQKKVAKGEPLPPGWQKKWAVGDIIEQPIYDTGVVIDTDDEKGTETVQINDEVVKVVRDTRRIVEIIAGL